MDPRPELECWAVDPFVSEFYAVDGMQGRIELDVARQCLRFALRSGSQDFAFEGRLEPSLPGFLAVCFTRVGPETLLLGGRDLRCGDAALARVRFFPHQRRFRAQRIDWTGPRFEVVSSLDRFPEGERLALLDHVSQRILVFEPSTRSMRQVAGPASVPSLAGLRHVHVWPAPAPAPKGAAVIWATRVDEAGLALGQLIGPSVRLADLDGDGLFESVP